MTVPPNLIVAASGFTGAFLGSLAGWKLRGIFAPPKPPVIGAPVTVRIPKPDEEEEKTPSNRSKP